MVEFDKKPVDIEEPLDLLQEMSELYGQMCQSSDQFLDWSNLARVNASLPKFDLMQSYDIPAAKFLSKIAEELADKLSAERCIFFEIYNEGEKSSLRTTASSPKIGNNLNIFWEQELNKLFVEEIQQHLYLRQKVNYEELKLFDFSGAVGTAHYVVFATRLQARLNSREVLFVSLKCAKDSNLSKSQIPRVASNILAIQLQYISSILERKKHASCAKTLNKA